MFFIINPCDRIHKEGTYIRNTNLNSGYYMLDTDSLDIEYLLYSDILLLLDTGLYIGNMFGRSIGGVNVAKDLCTHATSIYHNKIKLELNRSCRWDTVMFPNHKYFVSIKDHHMLLNCKKLSYVDSDFSMFLGYCSGFDYFFIHNNMLVGRYLILDEDLLMYGLVTFLFSLEGELLGICYPDLCKDYETTTVATKYKLFDTNSRY